MTTAPKPVDQPDPILETEWWVQMTWQEEVLKLNRFLEALQTWEAVSRKRLHKFMKRKRTARERRMEEHGFDFMANEAPLLMETERVMYATLGVTIAAVAENFIYRLCNERGIQCHNPKNKDKENDFGAACTKLGKALSKGRQKVDIARLPGYSGNQRARMLGNCFKHTNGKTDKKFTRKFGGMNGIVIEYENEKWPAMIADTDKLMTEIIGGLCKKRIG